MTPPPFYKLYKKTGKLVSGGVPKLAKSVPGKSKPRRIRDEISN